MGRCVLSLLLTVMATVSSTQAASPIGHTPDSFGPPLNNQNPSGARLIELAPNAVGEWKEIGWQEYSDILCDPQGTWAIKDVTTEPISRNFSPNNTKEKAVPCNAGALWIRLRLRSNLPFNFTWWLDPGLWELVDLYMPVGSEYSHSRSGYFVPLPQRASQEVHPYSCALPLRIASGPREMTVIFRLSGNMSAKSEIGGVLYPYLAGTIGKASRAYLFSFANIIGVLLALGLYHLILAFRVREKIYFYFGLSILGYALRVALYDGLLLEFVWPNSPHWDYMLRPLPYPVWEVPFFLFLMAFLRTKENMPRIHVLIKILLVTAALSPLGAWLLPVWHIVHWYQPTVRLLSVVWGATPIIVAALAWRSRRKEALLFLAANLLILIHTITQGLVGLRLISINFRIFWIWYIAVLCAAILFSLALAEHIRRLRLEKELAKSEEAEKTAKVQRAGLEATRLAGEIYNARWKALRNQLQPHFLFNTLKSIMALMHQDVILAERKLTLLSDILRIVLQEKSGSEVRLAEEISFVNRFLDIERRRGLPSFSVVWEVAPDTTDCLIPLLTLQLLVENALEKAAIPNSKPSVIVIRSWHDGCHLLLTVGVDGGGVDDTNEMTEGHPLSHSQDRSQQFNGAAAHFRTLRAAGEGCVATITLPFRTSETAAGSLPRAGFSGERP